MIGRLPALLVTGCIALASLILVEIGSRRNDSPTPEPVVSQVDSKPVSPRLEKPGAEDLIATALASPLFSPTRRAPETAAASDAADPGLTNVRLTGIVVEPDRRIAIFALAGGKPLALTEGEALQDWRVDSISPERVSVVGSSGTRILEPKPDTNLVRPSLPAPKAAQPPSGTPPAGVQVPAPGQPNAAATQAGNTRPAAAPPRIQLPGTAPPGSRSR